MSLDQIGPVVVIVHVFGRMGTAWNRVQDSTWPELLQHFFRADSRGGKPPIPKSCLRPLCNRFLLAASGTHGTDLVLSSICSHPW
ncbi:hypothetical protein ACIOEW_39085 [Streptomyces sp. NPDC087901]|uniref:hypothetical protein n=1 Tax=Streptomyces sp. NPDC087901 TaxID=3365818 RepID=UPI003800AA7D